MNDVKLNYALTCDQAILDQKGKLSLIGIFTNINTTQVPAIHPSFSLVVNTYGKSGRYKEKIEFFHEETNSVLISGGGEIEIKENSRNTLRLDFMNTIFPHFGKYQIRVTINDSWIISDPTIHYVSVSEVKK